jgi:hypothetical protein
VIDHIVSAIIAPHHSKIVAPGPFFIIVMSAVGMEVSQYALPSVAEPGHGPRAIGVGADFLINTTLAAGNLSRVGIAIGALPPTRDSNFTCELRDLEAALAKLSQIAQTIGAQAAQLHQRVKDAAAQRNACAASLSVDLTATGSEAALPPAV